VIPRRGGARRACAALATWLGLLAGCGTDLGSTCASDEDCAAPFVCHRPGSAATDAGAPAGVCSPALAAQGERCASTRSCGRDLVCSNGLPSEEKRRYGSCIPRRALGESCTKEAPCAPGLDCPLDGAGNGVCSAPDAPATAS
jgi:hypothetical protein